MSEIDTRIQTYEGMFLFPQSATSDLQGSVDHITDILQRGGAEIIALRKWDERRLAYDIHGNKRGVYFLAYFKAKTQSLAGMERDVFMAALKARNIGTGLHFRGAHLQKYYRESGGWRGCPLPNTEWNSERICSLPLFPDLTESDFQDVLAAIRATVAA